jgi:ParB family chromosome partitioning protein
MSTRSTSQRSIGFEVGGTYRVPPGALVIGANVRSDTHPGAKEFAASIKARGVLEPITAWVDDDGRLVVYRGQRRTLSAASVGTPDGLVPVHVVTRPAEVDRVTDQLVENVHRAAMRAAEERDAIEQLSLLGVSAAQITKRTAITRPKVDAALTVSASQIARERMDAAGMTLEAAATFAEFEEDPQAIQALEQALSWGRPLEHTAQRLRDARAEEAALRAHAQLLRGQGVPVLDPQDVPDRAWTLHLDALVTADGESVPEHDWPSVPGAAVLLRSQWAYPDERDDPDTSNTDGDPDGDGEPALRFVQVWICTDPQAAGLRSRYDSTGTTTANTSADDEDGVSDNGRSRRAVIANNAAWRSAQTVRRAWLGRFITRASVPAGAETLICEAVLTGQYTLSKAMGESHPLLRTLLGHEQKSPATPLATPTTAKAATVRTLAAVLASWEASTGVHTWRHPTAWDARVMGVITGWGYQPSDVEQLLTATVTSDTGADDSDAA